MTNEEQAQKYTYKYKFTAPEPVNPKDEPDKAALQNYINEILGIPRPRNQAESDRRE
jgi:hypothetical protein